MKEVLAWMWLIGLGIGILVAVYRTGEWGFFATCVALFVFAWITASAIVNVCKQLSERKSR